MFSVPERIADAVPNFLFPVIFVGISHWLVDKYQSEGIKEVLENGGEKHSNWRAFGIPLLLGVITLVGIMVVAFLLGDLLGDSSNY